MRNSYIVNILPGVFVVLAVLAACRNAPVKTAKHGYHEERVDSSVVALTRPVNASIVATIPDVTPQQGTRTYSATVNGVIGYDTRNQTSISSRVGGRIERLLVKYNYQPVRKGQLIMEVYSPDLAAAQRELLYVAKSNNELLTRARQRLQLLGMQPAQIEQVLKSGNILYRVPVYSNSDGYILEKSAQAITAAAPASPASAVAGDGMSSMGESSAPAAATPASTPAATPVMLREGQYVSAGQLLFTIYQNKDLVAEFSFPPQLAPRIANGQQLLFYPVDDKQAMQAGKIGLVEPVFRNGQNFTIARVYLGRDNFHAGQLLNASIPLIFNEGWWLPEKAVTWLGSKAVVFRNTGKGYVPQEVTVGAKVSQMVQVMTNINDWKVAANAAYLVDSESFIKTSEPSQRQ